MRMLRMPVRLRIIRPRKRWRAPFNEPDDDDDFIIGGGTDEVMLNVLARMDGITAD